MNLTCNLPEERCGEILDQFDGVLSCEEEEAVRSLFPQYLFFYNSAGDDSGYDTASTPVRICYCTSCRRSFEGVRANYPRGKMHNEDVTCPLCQASLVGKAVYKHRYDMPGLVGWVKTATIRPAGDGGLMIEAGNARRRFTWDDLEGTIDWYPIKRYYLNKGTVQMWHQMVDHWGWHVDEVEISWHTKKAIGDPFAPNMQGYSYYDGHYSVIGLPEALERSSFQYCQILPFYEHNYGALIADLAPARWIVKYLAAYALYPQVEMAVKFGLYEAVENLVVDGKKNARVLDWSAERPDAFLRMSKQDARQLIKAGLDFKDLRDWRELAGGMSLGRFLSLVDQIGGSANMRELCACAKAANTPTEKAVHYIVGLQPECARYAASKAAIIRTWKDYLDMAQKLDYDLAEPTVAMPKDLQQRHDAAADIIRTQASEAEMKKYRKRLHQLEKRFAFSLGGLCIVIPTSAEEIVQEGKTLHHCVGGCAARHIDGTATILFLRHQRKPARSFLTIELYELKGKIKIRQIHGYRNEGYSEKLPRPSMADKYAWFLEPWLEWVNAGSKRDKNGNPILSDTQEVKTA